MSKVLDQIEALPWVNYVRDTRNVGGEIHVQLAEGFYFGGNMFQGKRFLTVTQARTATRRSNIDADETGVLAEVNSLPWVQTARAVNASEHLAGSASGSYKVYLHPGWVFTSPSWGDAVKEFSTLEELLTGTVRRCVKEQKKKRPQSIPEAVEPEHVDGADDSEEATDADIRRGLRKLFYVQLVERTGDNKKMVRVVLEPGFAFKRDGAVSKLFADETAAHIGCDVSRIKMATAVDERLDDDDGERYRFIRDTPWLDTPLADVIAGQKNAIWDQEIDKARFAARVQKSLADPRPSVPHDQVMKDMEQVVRNVSIQVLQAHPLVKYASYDPETDSSEVLVTLQDGYSFTDGSYHRQFENEDQAYAELRDLLRQKPLTQTYAVPAKTMTVKIPSFNAWWCEQEKGLRDAYISDKWMLVNLAYRTAIGHTIAAASQIIQHYTGIPADAKHPTRDRIVVMGEDLIKQLGELRTRGDF